MINTLNVSSLTELLKMFGVPVESWGTGQAKQVSDLGKEIGDRECHLRIDDGGITRVVEIVKMHLRDPVKQNRGTLKQIYEILPDGRKKERNNHPSGMIKSGEKPDEALIREIFEELKLKSGSYGYHPLVSRVEMRDSKSFPGITCKYIIHPFEIVPNPGTSVLENEFDLEEKDGTILHFQWVKES